MTKKTKIIVVVVAGFSLLGLIGAALDSQPAESPASPASCDRDSPSDRNPPARDRNACRIAAGRPPRPNFGPGRLSVAPLRTAARQNINLPV